MKPIPLFLCLALSLSAIAQKRDKDPSEKDVATLFSSLPVIDGDYEWTDVVAVDSTVKKDDLYRRAKSFFAEEFKSAKDVIQYDDRGEGKLIGKGTIHIEDGQGVFTVYFTDSRWVNFTLDFYCKDGRYKYRIHAISIDQTLDSRSSDGQQSSSNHLSIVDAYKLCNKGMTKKMDRREFAAMIEQIQSTIADLKKAMIRKSQDDF